MVFALALACDIRAQDGRLVHAEYRASSRPDAGTRDATQELLRLMLQFVQDNADKRVEQVYEEYLAQLATLNETGALGREEINRLLDFLAKLRKSFDDDSRERTRVIDAQMALLDAKRADLRRALLEKQRLAGEYEAFVRRSPEVARAANMRQRRLEESINKLMADFATKMVQAAREAQSVKNFTAPERLTEPLRKKLEQYRAAENQRSTDAHAAAIAYAREVQSWRSNAFPRVDSAEKAAAIEKKENDEILAKYRKGVADHAAKVAAYDGAWNAYRQTALQEQEARKKVKDWEAPRVIIPMPTADSLLTVLWDYHARYVRSGVALWAWTVKGQPPRGSPPGDPRNFPGWAIYEVPNDIIAANRDWMDAAGRLPGLKIAAERAVQPGPAPVVPKLVTTRQEEHAKEKAVYDLRNTELEAELRRLGDEEQRITEEVRRNIEERENATIEEINRITQEAERRKKPAQERLLALHTELSEKYGPNYGRLYEIYAQYTRDRSGSSLRDALERLPITDQNDHTRALLYAIQSHGLENVSTARLATLQRALAEQARIIDTLAEGEAEASRRLDALRADADAARTRFLAVRSRLESDVKAREELNGLSRKQKALKELYDLRAELVRKEAERLAHAVSGSEVPSEDPAGGARLLEVLEALVGDGALTAAAARQIRGAPTLSTLLLTSPLAAETRDWGSHREDPVVAETELKDQAKEKLLSDWYGALARGGRLFEAKRALQTGSVTKDDADSDWLLASIFRGALRRSVSISKLDYADKSHAYRVGLDGETFYLGNDGRLERDPSDLDRLFSDHFETPESLPNGRELRVVNHRLKLLFANGLKLRGEREQDGIALALSLLREADRMPEIPEKRQLIELAKSVGEIVADTALRLSHAGAAIDLYEGVSGYSVRGERLSRMTRIIALVGALAGHRQLAEGVLRPVLGRMVKLRNLMREGRDIRELELVAREAGTSIEAIRAAGARLGVRTPEGMREYAKIHKLLESLPDGLKIQRIREGTQAGKVAIIGRKMGPIREARAQIGESVALEVFEPPQAVQDAFENAIEKYREAHGKAALLPDGELLGTEMFRKNKEWVEKLKAEGYTVLDLGNPSGATTESLFYEMEKRLLFSDP